MEDFILQYSQAQRLAFSLSDQLSSSGDLSLSHLQEDKKPEYFYIQQKPAASHSAALAHQQADSRGKRHVFLPHALLPAPPSRNSTLLWPPKFDFTRRSACRTTTR